MRTPVLWFASLSAAAPLIAAEAVDYARDVEPLLTKHCKSCHGPAKKSSGLRLDSAAAALKGGNAGPSIVPGKSAESLLINAVRGTNGAEIMPPKGPRLTKDEVAVLAAWIDQGAKGASAPAGGDDHKVHSDHWAFKAPVRPTPPTVKAADRVRNPIDNFIIARLEKEKLTPSPVADPVTLIRRLSLDLLGLPPTPAEVDAFAEASRAKPQAAYDELVERLLASPHYGERWGRHWLDLARYADSNGFTIDSARSIWKYRDWVIDALNRDLPFDRFVIEQLAGDLLPNATQEQKIATGFHRNTLVNEEGGTDPEQFRVEAVVDRTNTTGTVFLGLTVGCCQCHDHKFDPVSQRDYYRLFAFFNNCDEPKLEFASTEQLAERDALLAKIVPLEKDLYERTKTWERGLTPEARAKFPKPVMAALEMDRDQRTAAQKKVLEAEIAKSDKDFAKLVKEIAALRKSEKAFNSTLVMAERKNRRPTFIHIRGDFLRKGIEVTPGVPSVLPQIESGERGASAPRLPNRLDLATWMVSPQNPLTARVTVNCLWQAYFGVGLVETENDFGAQGAKPSHPDLLDWLATELPARKWSLKEMHRLIVCSATYRQASRRRPELDEVDPRNKLLGRQNRLRLEAEIVRDNALAACGLLAPKIGGPSVFPPQPDGADAFTQNRKNWKTSAGADAYRRGMYTFFWRSAPHPGLTVFDAPEANATCTRRNRSNTPLQALTLANDAAFVEFARALALRTLKESGPADAERLRHAFRLCLAREPNPVELDRLAKLLAKEQAAFRASPAESNVIAGPAGKSEYDRGDIAAWTMVGRVLMNLDEFITRE